MPKSKESPSPRVQMPGKGFGATVSTSSSWVQSKNPSPVEKNFTSDQMDEWNSIREKFQSEEKSPFAGGLAGMQQSIQNPTIPFNLSRSSSQNNTIDLPNVPPHPVGGDFPFFAYERLTADKGKGNISEVPQDETSSSAVSQGVSGVESSSLLTDAKKRAINKINAKLTEQTQLLLEKEQLIVKAKFEEKNRRFA